MLGKFTFFSADFFFFFFEKFFQEYHISVLSSLDPDQAKYFVGPDLGPSCLLGKGHN